MESVLQRKAWIAKATIHTPTSRRVIRPSHRSGGWSSFGFCGTKLNAHCDWKVEIGWIGSVLVVFVDLCALVCVLFQSTLGYGFQPKVHMITRGLSSFICFHSNHEVGFNQFQPVEVGFNRHGCHHCRLSIHVLLVLAPAPKEVHRCDQDAVACHALWHCR